METKYKNTLLQLLVAFGGFLLLAPSAHALTNTPLDCLGVIAVKNGYRLTQDTTCDTGTNGNNFSWDESNKVFNLNGYTLTANNISLQGSGLTIRNGSLKINKMNWAFCSTCSMTNLSVTGSDAPPPRGILIEAGYNMTVQRCTFYNIPGLALDFYYQNGGAVKNSTFIGNGIAVSIQKHNNMLIEDNKFLSNGKGVNLWNEDNVGVNNNKIQYNTFRENDVAIKILADPLLSTLFNPTTMDGNQFLGNKISRSIHSGLLIEVLCEKGGQSTQPVCPVKNTIVSGNRFNRNGFGALTGLPIGVEPNDDGVTARAFSRNAYYDTTPYPYPEGLSGVTLTNNRADRNADLGFDVEGVTDGGGQVANFNGNPSECIGIVCDNDIIDTATAERSAISLEPSIVLQGEISGISFDIDQLRHTK